MPSTSRSRRRSPAARRGPPDTAGSVSSAPETLSFGGALFPAGVKLTLPVGSTLQDTVSLINNTSSLNSRSMPALTPSNHLVICLAAVRLRDRLHRRLRQRGRRDQLRHRLVPRRHLRRGCRRDHQRRTGDGHGPHTDGERRERDDRRLAASGQRHRRPPATTPGHVTVKHGVADGLNQTLTQILDPVNGAVAGAETSLNSQISDTQDQIAQIQTEVSTYKDYLTQMFSDMETRVSALQAQGNAFAAQIGSTHQQQFQQARPAKL